MTRNEVSEALGLSLSEVRQAEAAALGKLIAGFEAAGLGVEDRPLLESILAELFDGEDGANPCE